ncbi:MAG: endo-1,4-beta-xylanase [Treponema sp.]|nr:endo-1,4-beta-xylanase [Treponema sp.]
MKKLSFLLAGLFIISALSFTGCKTDSGEDDKTGNTTIPTKKETVYTIDAGTTTAGGNWNIVAISLQDFANQTVNIDFSADMKVENTGDSANIMWSVTAKDAEGGATYPTIASKEFAAGTTDWTPVSGTRTNIILNDGPSIYISTYEITPENLKISLKSIKIVVTNTADSTDTNTYSEIEVKDGITKETIEVELGDWLDSAVPSLKDTYKDKFDSIGIACEYSSWNGVKELSVQSVRDGLAKHADSVSMGNEFKPDGFFGYQWTGTGKAMVDFTASNGLTIKVPKDLQYDTQDKCLAACKEAGLKMRGHVLAWHAQTPEAFFTVDYAAAKYDDATTQNILTNRVSKEIMQARLEWYIKTVLKHVADWEATNGYRAIWAWDVFNETVADDASATNWVRGSTPGTEDRPPAVPAVNPGPCGSRWYQCYGDTDFIVDAFRFANAYAPADVKLCYNDYNEYMNYDDSLKTDGIMKLIQLVKNGEAKTINGKSVKPRIDVMGMQSHVGVSWPGVSGYETALKRFLTEVDVHVTELDIACTTEAESEKCWSDYFKMLQKYGNGYSGDHKITNITIWGINNKTSWIYKGDVKYPVLFEDYYPTVAFWAVISAHK